MSNTWLYVFMFTTTTWPGLHICCPALQLCCSEQDNWGYHRLRGETKLFTEHISAHRACNRSTWKNGGSISGCSSLHVKVSLCKMLSSKLLLIAVPLVCDRVCVFVLLMSRFAFWIKPLSLVYESVWKQVNAYLCWKALWADKRPEKCFIKAVNLLL